MEKTHKTTEVFTSLRAIDKTVVMIHATDMTKDMTQESKNQYNRKEWFNLSHP